MDRRLLRNSEFRMDATLLPWRLRAPFCCACLRIVSGDPEGPLAVGCIARCAGDHHAAAGGFSTVGNRAHAALAARLAAVGWNHCDRTRDWHTLRDPADPLFSRPARYRA